MIIRENEKRKDVGRIPTGYSCAQLKTRRTLYRDEYNQPIELEIKFRTGCELRCLNTYCDELNVDDQKTQLSQNDKKTVVETDQ